MTLIHAGLEIGAPIAVAGFNEQILMTGILSPLRRREDHSASRGELPRRDAREIPAKLSSKILRGTPVDVRPLRAG